MRWLYLAGLGHAWSSDICVTPGRRVDFDSKTKASTCDGFLTLRNGKESCSVFLNPGTQVLEQIDSLDVRKKTGPIRSIFAYCKKRPDFHKPEFHFTFLTLVSEVEVSKEGLVECKGADNKVLGSYQFERMQGDVLPGVKYEDNALMAAHFCTQLNTMWEHANGEVENAPKVKVPNIVAYLGSGAAYRAYDSDEQCSLSINRQSFIDPPQHVCVKSGDADAAYLSLVDSVALEYTEVYPFAVKGPVVWCYQDVHMSNRKSPGHRLIASYGQATPLFDPAPAPPTKTRLQQLQSIFMSRDPNYLSYKDSDGNKVVVSRETLRGICAAVLQKRDQQTGPHNSPGN